MKSEKKTIGETKERLIFEEFNEKINSNEEKIIKNKYKISDIFDKRSILNKRNENEYNKDIKSSFEEGNNEKDNVNIKDDKSYLLVENNINNNDNKNNVNKETEEKYNNNLKNNHMKVYSNEKYIKNNNSDEEKTENENILNNKNNNSNYINKENEKEISQFIKLNKNLLLSPKNDAVYTNHNILKPLNIFASKKPKIPINNFQTPYKSNKNTIDNKIKTFNKTNQLNTPTSIAQENIKGNKLFKNEPNFSKINSKRGIENEKENRNKSLINIIDHKNHHNVDYNIGKENNHYHDEINSIINKGKKFQRHFGKEENCPICVALQMKNKFLEEKNTLPLLDIKNLKKNEQRTNTQSPNHKTVNVLVGQRNKEKMNRIMSCKPEYFRNRVMRRNESAKEVMNINNRNVLENGGEFFNSNNKKISERFPCLNAYFNDK